MTPPRTKPSRSSSAAMAASASPAASSRAMPAMAGTSMTSSGPAWSRTWRPIPTGDHFIAGAKGGYLMPLGSVRVGPVIALDYAKAKVDGYTEDGDPALTLNVDSLSYKSLRGSAGRRGARRLRRRRSAASSVRFGGGRKGLHRRRADRPLRPDLARRRSSTASRSRTRRRRPMAGSSLGFSAAILSSSQPRRRGIGDDRQGPGRGDLGTAWLPLRLLRISLQDMQQGRGAAGHRVGRPAAPCRRRNFNAARSGKQLGDVARTIVGRTVARHCPPTPSGLMTAAIGTDAPFPLPVKLRVPCAPEVGGR